MPIELVPFPAAPENADHRPAKWYVVTPPAGRVVSWAEAKAHLRLDVDDDQAYVESLIDAATDFAEDRLAAALMEQTILATFYDGEPIQLPRGPLLEVQSVVDADDVTIGPADYTIEHVGYSARLKITKPFEYPLSVTFRAGCEDATSIPAATRLAILAHVGTLYENRESVSDRTKTVVPHSLEDFYRLKRRTVGVG